MNFSRKISKKQSPDKTLCTIYYPHNKTPLKIEKIENLETLLKEKYKKNEYIQIVSIDPGIKNYAFRIERRYKNGWITPVVFDKWLLEESSIVEDFTFDNKLESLNKNLLKYKEYILSSHMIIIEKQMPFNYKAVRISQHTVSFFYIVLENNNLNTIILEIDAKIKGKILGSPKNINETQLKKWAVEKAVELLEIRKDEFSLKVISYYKSKKDDLADTVCQIEALCVMLNLGKTEPPPMILNLKVK